MKILKSGVGTVLNLLRANSGRKNIKYIFFKIQAISDQVDRAD